MAWRNSGVLIRQLLGRRSNPCRCAGLIHHQHQNYSSLTSIQTLTLTSSPSLPHTSAIHVSSASKLLLSHDSHHFLPHRQHYCSAADPIDPTYKELYVTAKYEMLMKKIEDKYPPPASASASDTSFSTPSDMVIIWDKKALKRAITEVKYGRLQAVFYFTSDWAMPPIYFVTPTIRKLRERFPQVIIYKIMNGQLWRGVDMADLILRMRVSRSPEFHFYRNGKKVDEIKGPKLDSLIDTFGKLYRYVIPTSSSGMGKRRTQPLVVQVKKDDNGNGVKGGRKVASAGTFSQHRGALTLPQQSGCLGEADESSTAPSLCQVMQDVESSYPYSRGENYYQYWWFAKGLFKCQPEKRVIFSDLTHPYDKIAWLSEQIADE